MSLIVIEGLDGTGKTSLAERLRKEFGYEIAFSTSRKNTKKLKNLDIHVNDYHEDVHFINQWSNIGFNAICDRSFISGVVYDEQTKKSTEVFNYCMEQIRKRKDEIYFVLLKAKDETVIDRDDNWKGKKSKLQYHRYLFDNIFRHRLKDFKTLIVKTDGKTVDKVNDEVVQWLRTYNL